VALVQQQGCTKTARGGGTPHCIEAHGEGVTLRIRVRRPPRPPTLAARDALSVFSSASPSPRLSAIHEMSATMDSVPIMSIQKKKPSG
jgi:hypothetical protein